MDPLFLLSLFLSYLHQNHLYMHFYTKDVLLIRKKLLLGLILLRYMKKMKNTKIMNLIESIYINHEYNSKIQISN